MSEPNALTWEVLSDWLSRHPRPYWFFDLDGTLIDLASRPDAVSVSPDLIASLERLQSRFDGRVAIVSGRSLADLESRVPVPITRVGNHGAEFRQGGARWVLPLDRRVQDAFDRLRPHLRALASQYPGAFLEDKGPTISFHVRHLSPSETNSARHALQRLMAREAGLVMRPAQACWEIRPEHGPDKGLALETLLGAGGDDEPIVFGDDVTDEDAFRAAARHHGLTVVVGPRRPTQAGYRLDRPSDLRDLLHRLTS